MNCYNFVEYNFKEGLLDQSIDATYVIHLENNGRIDNILNQINKYKPTKKIYILYNKGYKKCNKNLSKNIPDKDLVECNFTIFKHANNFNYNNILILEDDFMFSDKINNKDILKDLNNFFNQHINQKFIYYFGAVTIYSVPYKVNHYRSLFISLSHCVTHSKNTREYLLANENNIKNTEHFWDIYLNSDSNINKYHYKYPLCYQIFPVTENQKNWKFSNNSFLNYIIINGSKLSIKLLNIDKYPEPGFTIIYTISILSFYISIFFMVFIIYKYIKLNKKIFII
jgi:hypothetical protein